METHTLRDFRIPAWATAGLHDPAEVDGRIAAAMTIGAHLRSSDGTLNPAVLAAVADGCLGLAVMAGAGFDTGVVTSHLHLEFPRCVPGDLDTAHCSAVARSVDRGFGLSEATITDATGATLAYATLGGVLVPRPTTEPRQGPRTAVPVVAEHLDELLGAHIGPRTPEGATATFRAGAALANLYTNLHGGLGALIAIRTLDAGLDTGNGSYRLADLRAVFTRSIPADGNELQCRATVAHRGRRMAAGRAELLASDGRVALSVDATYVADNS
ncbi:hypothetical protein HZU40_03040 [Mycolicibacterium fluoranthenivorans]|uniref:PaaI family thioesterase n=1 Tax=Mycolicibacterium fluoranthenivorans TaxID=258505 RepID=A0A7G8PG87_9MYCO|nr:hypothetical protein [Mycolicibacterium fluoranthenivorans]QNJ93353.1 hypothetical protein HZU40_03040 [Mycolicibacterium fluoranthenivorans]